MPRVSVMMPAYNRAHYIRDSIASVQAQTYTDWELLIVDDGSSDATFTIAQQAAEQDPRIRVFQNERNMGIAYSRNYLLQQANGEYLAVLDSDDIALPNRLAQQVAYLDAHPQVGLLGMDGYLINEQGERLKAESIYANWPLPAELIPWVLLWYNPFIHSTVMLRAHVLRQLSLAYPAHPPSEDYALYLNLCLHTSMSRLQTPGVLLRLHVSNASSLDYQKMLKHIQQFLPEHYNRFFAFTIPSDAQAVFLAVNRHYSEDPMAFEAINPEQAIVALQVLGQLYQTMRGQLSAQVQATLRAHAVTLVRLISLRTNPRYLLSGLRALNDIWVYPYAAYRLGHTLLRRLKLPLKEIH